MVTQVRYNLHGAPVPTDWRAVPGALDGTHHGHYGTLIEQTPDDVPPAPALCWTAFEAPIERDPPRGAPFLWQWTGERVSARTGRPITARYCALMPHGDPCVAEGELRQWFGPRVRVTFMSPKASGWRPDLPGFPVTRPSRLERVRAALARWFGRDRCLHDWRERWYVEGAALACRECTRCGARQHFEADASGWSTGYWVDDRGTP